MSYGFSPLDGNALRAMVPLMGNMSNMANGTNFLPQLAVASGTGAMPTLTGPSLLPAHLPAGLNDSPLEFKTNTNSSMPKSTIDKASKPINNQMGAGPMDLENDNEAAGSLSIVSSDASKRLSAREHKLSSSSLDDDSNSIKISESNVQSAVQNKSIVMGNEMFLNGMIGVGPPPPQHHHHHAAHPHQGFMVMPGMMMDPTTMAATLQMQQFPLMAAIPQQAPPTQTANSQQQSDPSQPSQQMLPVQIKELITCKSCTLYPPNPNAPPPTIRERPPGCRTVFVGGLPENISEDIIREIFESCGEITTLRLSKKNFCHIRFVFEASVDSAIYLSGYRIRIANSSDSSNCGRLHVDYAQARDDQYEWECKQRQLQREQRHRERMERDRLRSMSPPPIVHYTEHEAGNLSDKLKNDETFIKAVLTLVAWLERGDCSKKNANTFYSMIQSTNAHVRRLQNDKLQFEDELKRAREQYRKQMLNMTQQFTQIEKVFSAACHKKVWDHFTKAQRKNIDLWKKQSTEIRCVQIDDDEMEMSDDDRDYNRTSNKRAKFDNDNLKEENDSLRCQLEAYRNEMNLVKSDLKSDTDFREQQIKVLQETIRNLQTQLLDNKLKEKDFHTKVADLETKLKQANVKELLLKTKIVEASTRNSIKSTDIDELEKTHSDCVAAHHYEEDGGGSVASSKSTICPNETNNQGTSVPSFNSQIKTEKIERNEARIIGLVSTFLVVHPFGASTDYICSYLQKLHPNLRPRELEEILNKYGTLFCEEVTGIGAKIERKWKFCGFTDGLETTTNSNE